VSTSVWPQVLQIRQHHNGCAGDGAIRVLLVPCRVHIERHARLWQPGELTVGSAASELWTKIAPRVWRLGREEGERVNQRTQWSSLVTSMGHSRLRTAQPKGPEPGSTG